MKNSHHVLFVDDDTNFLKGLRRRFEGVTSFTPHFIDSPHRALELLNTIPISAVVVDLKMPRISGIEFLSRVRFLLPNCRRVLLSGSVDLTSAVRAVNDGAINKILEKPCSSFEIAKAVSHELSDFEEHARTNLQRPIRKMKGVEVYQLQEDIPLEEALREAGSTNQFDLGELINVKGVIFTMFEEFVAASWSQDLFEQIYAETALIRQTKEAYVSPGHYLDEDLYSLFSALSGHTGIRLDEILRNFGLFMFPKLVLFAPEQMRTMTSLSQFLKGIGSIIHAHVKITDSQATPPKVECSEMGEGKFMLTYESQRKLYALAQGLLEGAAIHFNSELEMESEIIDKERGICQFRLKIRTIQ